MTDRPAPTDCRVRPPDPTDAAAADTFVSHRAGYGTQIDDLMRRAFAGFTMAAGEGAKLAQEIARLRAQVERVRAVCKEVELAANAECFCGECEDEACFPGRFLYAPLCDILHALDGAHDP